MAEEKEPKESMLQKTYRLPAGDVELIELLAAKQILGGNRSAVLRTLVREGLKAMVEAEYVRKHQETLELLRKK